MKAIAITNKGLENISALEIEQLLKTKITIHETVVEFDITSYEDLYKLTYKSQSLKRVCLLLSKQELDNLDNFKIDFKLDDFFPTKFAVRSTKLNTDLTKAQIERSIGEKIFELTKSGVDLVNPQTTVHVHVVNKTFYIGIDFSGELDKREYLIYQHTDLKPNVAFAAVFWSGFKKQKILVDPFTLNGVIPIEACLYETKKSHLFYTKQLVFKKLKPQTDWEKLFVNLNMTNETETNIFGFTTMIRYLNSSKSNAKIAGVDKFLNLTNVDIDWLDTKFDKKQVDYIVTQPPTVGKYSKVKDIQKKFNELFYQAEFVLNPEGCMVIITDENTEQYFVEPAKKNRIKQLGRLEVYQGAKKFIFLKYIKQ